MSLSRLARQKLLLSPLLSELAGRALSYVDIGARGELDEPWSLMPSHALEVVGFEPDPDACAALNERCDEARRYIPAALWSQHGRITFHINKHASTSSVFPANAEKIHAYERAHWEGRETARTVEVEALSMDEVALQCTVNADMLKIDTQGCEMAILTGAVEVLKTSVAVLVETWTQEVYRGQQLTGDVLSFMTEQGYALYDVNLAAAWKRQRARDRELFCKPQVVGLDLLFIKDDTTALCHSGADKVIMAAAIADMFGFPDAALDMLENAALLYPGNTEFTRAARHIENIARRSNKLGQKIRRRMLRWFGASETPFPSLHY